MKRNITLILITLCLAIGVVSCSEGNGLCGYPSVAGGWFVE